MKTRTRNLRKSEHALLRRMLVSGRHYEYPREGLSGLYARLWRRGLVFKHRGALLLTQDGWHTARYFQPPKYWEPPPSTTPFLDLALRELGAKIAERIK